MPTRIVLDTAAIRGLIHGDAAVSALEDLHDHVTGLSIAVANNAVPELVVALHQGRLQWDKWSSRVFLLDRIVDPALPVLPDDAELGRVATGPELERRSALSRAEHSRAIRALLRVARGPQDLERGPSFIALRSA
jgi:hypothetical protein